MAHHVMTDKPNRKTLKCSFPTCEDTVEVTKFLAPHKARCPDHEGKASSKMRELVADRSSSVDLTPPTPNRALSDIRCPFCDTTLEIIRIDDKMGWITLKCTEDNTAIELKPKWAHAVMSVIPPHLKNLVAAFNETQRDIQATADRMQVGSFEIREGQAADSPQVWFSKLKGAKGEIGPELMLASTDFRLGTTVVVYEPVKKEVPDEPVS